MSLPRITAVAAGSPAALAGIEVGDEVLAVSGESPRDIIAWTWLTDDADPTPMTFGLGLQLGRREGRRVVGHGGSMPGFLAAVWAEPGTRDAAVVLANSTAGVPVGRVALDLLGLGSAVGADAATGTSAVRRAPAT